MDGRALHACFGGESFRGGTGGVARGNDSGEVGEDGGDLKAGDVLGEVAPVGADIAESGGCAAFGRIGAPGVDVGLAHPVLQIEAVNEADGAGFTAGDHAAGLLDERVAAIVEGDDVGDFGGAGGFENLAAFLRV